MFIHGGRLVNAQHPVADAIAVYEVRSCHDSTGAPSRSPGATYHLLPGVDGVALLERSVDGSVLITNRWQDATATHFFAWGAGLGWEYTLPSDGSPAERFGHRYPSSTEGDDGSRRPLVSRPPDSTCSLVLVSGAPPGATAGVRPATVLTVAAPPLPEPTPAVEEGAVAPGTQGDSSCAAGRVETADGHCCLPGQSWDASHRSCAAPSTACAEGRVETRDGYCCWPGQTFDRSVRACAGPPQCPAGLGAAGQECVPRSGAGAATAAPTAEGDVAALRAQGRAHFQARRYGDSAVAYERAARLAPENASLWSGLGAARLAGNDYAGAALAYQQAVRLAPTMAAYRVALGRAYAAGGQRAAARSEYERALEIEPDNREARLALSRL
ncbi:MAG: tetratricopeptide repeat protein [Sandaracinus sp.]